jgi:uncharacterized protein YjbI with pentapeptide repeats
VPSQYLDLGLFDCTLLYHPPAKQRQCLGKQIDWVANRGLPLVMPRKRTPTTRAVQPPQLPNALSPTSKPVILTDEAQLAGVTLLDTDLSGSIASDPTIEQVLCRRVRFTQAELERPQLSDVQFDTCDFAGATLTNAHLRRVTLVGCRLLSAALLDAQLDDVLVQRSNGEARRCWNSSLRAVRFERCSLRAASFAGTDLSGGVFHTCDLSSADFRDAKLHGADLRGSTITGLQIGLRELQGAIVSPAQAVELAQTLELIVRSEEPPPSNA